MNVDVPDSPDSRESDTGTALIAMLKAQVGVRCRLCQASLCPHQLLANYALGVRERPRCSRCLAETMGQSPADLAHSLFGYVRQRPCYAEAWDWASQLEGGAPDQIPPCLLGDKPEPPRSAVTQ